MIVSLPSSHNSATASLNSDSTTYQNSIPNDEGEISANEMNLKSRNRNDKASTTMVTMAYEEGDLKQMEQNLADEKSRGALTNFCGKRIPLYFRAVQVQAPGPSWSFFRIAYRMFHGDTTGSKPNHCVIKIFDAITLPGEMVLVLGRPGSGCTTLLRAIANEKMTPFKVLGTRKYCGIPGDEFAKKFPGETSFCAASDIHVPSLTVEQTLQFAIDLASSRTTDTAKKDILAPLLSLLGLNHTRDTLVGDARIRGVSGGERKRVSLAEALIARAAVMCFDNPTLGLDAGSAARFIRSLRMLTRLYESVAFVSLYQASDSLFDCFDKVILLEDGHQLYFGSAQSAVQYFEECGYKKLPGQTKADFLTSCIDPRHRSLSESNYTISLRDAFTTSDHWKHLQTGLDCVLQPENLAFEREVLEQTYHGSKQSQWLRLWIQQSLFWRQVAALAKRHLQLKSQDRFNVAFKNFTALIVALLCGSSYWQLPSTSGGAFTRGGVMFIALLFSSFTAFAELPLTVMGRSVLYKQASLLFYRSSALPFGQLLVDIPLAAVENLLFASVVYFMAGLERTAAGFFTFYLFIVLAQTCMTVFFRTLGSISKTLDAALRLACVIIILMVLSSGYLVPYEDQRPWLKWFYWLNPVRYAFAGMMVKEFANLNLICEDQHLIPNGIGYKSLANRVCTLAGAASGTNNVTGIAYLYATFGFRYGDLWLYAGVMIIFIFGLLLLNFMLNELISFETPERLLNIDDDKTRSPTRGDVEKSISNQPTVTVALTSDTLRWESLCYSIKIPGKSTRQLLHNISGECVPGRILALMGPSGAGKSTLLDVLAQRKSRGTILGNITLNKKPFTPIWRRKIGYCEQLDTLDPYQTVREALQFSALLRQPASVPQEDKFRYVEEIIDFLELQKLGSVLIGESPNGLSVEERKRLSIGIELVAKPGLLFLDEPTSGLDSQSAMSIVRFLRLLADAGQAIICTVHQPSAALYHHFDDLLLLHHGRTVYSGPAQDVGKFFHWNGFSPPADANTAEFMMQALTGDTDRSIEAEEWAQLWERYPNKQPGEIQFQSCDSILGWADSKESNYPTSLSFQLRTVTWKTTKSLLRQPGYSQTRIFNHVMIAVLTGLAYLNIGDSLVDLQYRIFVIFQVTILPSLVLSQVEPRFEHSRTLFYKDDDLGMYSKTVFIISQILSEVPLTLFCTILFFPPLYFLTNFSHHPKQAGYQFVIIYLTEQFSVLLGQAIAALTPSSYTASLLTPFLLITFSLFCGVTIPPPNIPKFWEWLYRLNPLTYLVGGMIETEFYNRPVRCADNEFSVFETPNGQKCGEYAAAFLEKSAGYLKNPNASSACAYCPYTSAEGYAAQFGLLWNQRWRDLAILVAYIVSTAIILLIAGTRINWRSR